jgi:hypothetical protein
MQRILAIAGLTWKAAFRFRLFLVVVVLLLGSVVGLPLLLKDDGTARGFTQILLTYTLTLITALLGLSTLWLSCGTLARDIEECQMQVVAVKPVARWQIWLGKWLGIMSLNAALLAISGGGVYALLQWRAAHLSPAEQTVLRTQVLVARGSAKEASLDGKIQSQTDEELRQRLAANPNTPVDIDALRKKILEQVKATYQDVPPGYARTWNIHLGAAKNDLHNQPLYLRIRFNSSTYYDSRTYLGLWQLGVPGKTKLWQSNPMSMSPRTFHEFKIPPDLFDKNGVLTINFVNLNNVTLLFPLDEGMEVLYPQGSFTLNFIRGLGIIFCWMALFAAIGLTASTFLSFPVAAFVSLGLLTIVLCSNTMAYAVKEGSVAPYNANLGHGYSPLDIVIIPAFRLALKVIHLAENFSPIDSLSTGRTISWGELGLAFGQLVVLLGGSLGLIGVFIFNRRELATAQGNQ